MKSSPHAHDAPLEPAVGTLAARAVVGGGRYVLKRLLGQGGMGVVWLAHDTRLREAVALKFLAPQIASDPAALEDLRRETWRTRKLSHPHIVRIYDLHEERGETPFLSMEYVDGPNLHFLRANRPARVLPWEFLAPLVRQLCAALEYAHGENVVHRDLKPANLMLDSQDRLKLADFGLARVVHDSWIRLTGQAFPGGTLGFMSPQQADGRKPQVTDDIYALGATLYDLLTSTPPFHTGDIAHQVRHTRPDPIPQRLLDLGLENQFSPDVEALVMACLAKNPEQRPEHAGDILAWLDAAERQGAQARVVEVPSAAPPGSSRPATRATADASPAGDRAPPSGEPPEASHARETLEPPAAAAPEPSTPPRAETPSSESAPAPSEVAPRPPRGLQWTLIGLATLAVVGMISVLSLRVLRRWAEREEVLPAGLAEDSLSASANRKALPVSGSRSFLGREQTLAGHRDAVNAVAFSPDNRWLVSGSGDGTVRVYETETGALKWTRTVHIRPVRCVAVSTDSRLLATGGSDQAVCLWEVAGGNAGAVLTGHQAPVLATTFSPAGRYLASCDDAGHINLWDYETRKLARQMNGPAGAVRSVAFTPDGQQLACAGEDGVVRFWSVLNGDLLSSLPAHRGSIRAVSFSPDGRFLASASRDRTMRIWDGVSHQPLRTVQWRSSVNCDNALAFSPDSRWLVGAGERSGVHWYEVATASRSRTKSLQKHSGAIHSVAFSPDGAAVASGGEDGLVKVHPFPAAPVKTSASN